MIDKSEARPDRPVAMPLALFQIEEQVARLKREPAWLSGTRNAITLVKQRDLRVVLVILKKGTTLQEHEARGAVTLHVLSGSVQLRAGGETLEIRSGGLVALQPALEHEVDASEETALLLTLVQP